MKTEKVRIELEVPKEQVAQVKAMFEILKLSLVGANAIILESEKQKKKKTKKKRKKRKVKKK